MKKNVDLGDFKPLEITKIGQFQVKGGGTYTLEGTTNSGSPNSTADFRRDDDKVACGVPDAQHAVEALDNWQHWQ